MKKKSVQPPKGPIGSDAQSFVANWSKVWNGRDSDPQLYVSLLHEDCVLVNRWGR